MVAGPGFFQQLTTLRMEQTFAFLTLSFSPPLFSLFLSFSSFSPFSFSLFLFTFFLAISFFISLFLYLSLSLSVSFFISLFFIRLFLYLSLSSSLSFFISLTLSLSPSTHFCFSPPLLLTHFLIIFSPSLSFYPSLFIFGLLY